MAEQPLLRYTFGKRRRRFLLPFIALVLLSIFVYCFLITYSTQSDVRYCFVDKSPLEETTNAAAVFDIEIPKRLPDILLADQKPAPGRSIFFHETSCHQPPPSGAADSFISSLTGSASVPVSINIVQLTARQACAIESAAIHNPNLSVYVLFASTAYQGNGTAASPLMEAILSYTNVHLRNLNLWTYAAGTPMYEWLKDGALFKSKHVLSHISDFLRYLTLWRWGGTYLDMDIVMLRSLEDLPPNYTGAESTTHLAAGVMNFAPTGFGHEVAEKCLRDLQHNFNGDDWGNNGPGVITRVMQSVCNTKNIALMMNRKRCMGFQVFNESAFYAIRWPDWKHFFETEYLEQTLEATKDSYVAHVWNKHSQQRRVKVGSNVAYGKLAERHCPKVYAASGEYF